MAHPELEKARATLSRRKEIEAEFARDQERRANTFEPLDRRDPTAIRTNDMTKQDDPWIDWNDWCRAHVDLGMSRVAQVLGSEVGDLERELVTRIELLEEQLGQLRAERAVERCAQAFDLPNWRSKQNAA
jgi:hypothetical protein